MPIQFLVFATVATYNFIDELRFLLIDGAVSSILSILDLSSFMKSLLKNQFYKNDEYYFHCPSLWPIEMAHKYYMLKNTSQQTT